MSDHKLRLVHSSSHSDKANTQRINWGFENARQLGLFEDLDKIQVLLVPVADVSAHNFRKVLMERAPKLIVDTRMFPDFFSIFSSTESALDEFNNKGIDYNRVPLSATRDNMTDWSRLAVLKSVLGSYLEKRTGAPVFILASTKKNSETILQRLKGYLSQEVAETNFEEFI